MVICMVSPELIYTVKNISRTTTGPRLILRLHRHSRPNEVSKSSSVQASRCVVGAMDGNLCIKMHVPDYPTPSCVMNCMHLVTPHYPSDCTTLQNLKIIIIIHYGSHPSLLRIIPSGRSLFIIFRRGSLHSCSRTRHIVGRSFGGDMFDNCGFFRRFTRCSFGFGGSEGYGGFFVGECVGC